MKKTILLIFLSLFIFSAAWGGDQLVLTGSSIQAAFDDHDLSPGDTIYVQAGTYTETVTWGANDVGTEGVPVSLVGLGTVIIDGESTRNVNIFLNNSQSHVTISNITLTGSTGANIILSVDNIGVSLSNVTMIGGTYGLNMSSADGHVKSDISVDASTFTGQSAANINWFVQSGSTCATSQVSLSNLSVTNSTFSGSNTNGAIHVRAEAHATCVPVFSGLVATGNTFTTPPEAVNAIRIYDANSEADTDYYWGGGFDISGNTVVGGHSAILVVGFDTGTNTISDNTISATTGPPGGILIFYSKNVIIEDNKISDGTIEGGEVDGGGIDIDHGNDGVIVRGNEINNMAGLSGVWNSGFAIMVLDSQNVSAYNNTGTGNRVGIIQAGNGTITNNNFWNNTFRDNLDYGFYISSNIDAAELAQLVWENNIFTGDGSAIDISDNSTGGGTLLENYNLYYNFSTNNEAGVNNVAADPLFQGVGPGIQFKSPAKDGGIIPVYYQAGQGYKDYCGNRRAYGSWYIGACDYRKPTSVILPFFSSSGPVVSWYVNITDAKLMELGDYVLMETGDKILLEQ